MSVRTFALPAEQRYFEDYPVGAVFEFGEIAVDEQELVEFARRYDPQSFHTDSEAAAQSMFGGLIASGWHTAALMMRMLVDHYLSKIASLASPGVDELRWQEPVRPGDMLRLRVTVQDARRSCSRDDRGVVNSSIEVFNQHDRVVMTVKATNFMLTRGDGE
jgi:acyl dehydratase